MGLPSHLRVAPTQSIPTRYVTEANGLLRKGVKHMNRIIAGLFAGLFSACMAYAQAPVATQPAAAPAQTTAGEAAVPAVSGCEAKAVSKSGKPLAGAAKRQRS